MSRNVFDKIGDIRNNVRRNNFDWSHDNNFTTGLGRITPVFCEYCPPNSSLRIDPTFGLRFMPMMFPVQTKVKAYLSFYRVPIRTLWKDYKDWISSPNDQNNDLEPPYLSIADNMYGDGNTFGVSGLADYLGVPVTLAGDSVAIAVPTIDATTNPQFDPEIAMQRNGSNPIQLGDLVTSASNETFVNPNAAPTFRYGIPLSQTVNVESGNDATTLLVMDFNFTNYDIALGFWNAFANVSSGQYQPAAQLVCFNTITQNVSSVVDIVAANMRFNYNSDGTYTIHLERTIIVPDGCSVHLMCSNYNSIWNSNGTMFGDKTWSFDPAGVSGIQRTTSPYYSVKGSNTNKVKLSAYPFRAYEAIYNAYIRNNKNNPFVLNGKEVYNKWITTDEGGADTTPYHLFQANWASDAFTTAVPSPQQGQAPLVGLTTYEQTFALENGHTETKLGTAIVDEDGKKYAVDFESNGEALKGVKYTELDAGTPVAPVTNLYDVVTSGISINDFRNVNAYQRYLELNMFRGYSYKQIIEGRFDVNIKYDDLNMPEYIGGLTRDVVINPVTQTVQTGSQGLYDGALGSMAGNATCFGDTKAKISCFCDEESYVIGLLTVVPMPVYTQVLPKHFLYRDRLDMFNPEFDHIGFQPILNKELCPVQTFNAAPTEMENVFGYQRPWYEYCQKVDTAHGLFRTQLRNFLINRVFSATPELGAAFTTVDEAQVNDVFAVTETTDKILGQIHFDVTAKLPISRVVVPKLE